MNAQPPLEGMPAASQPEVAAAIYTPFPTGLVQCAVVVDTRNMHGQARRVFGRGLRPYATGIRAALRDYGFDAVEIYAGVATKTMASSPSDRVQSALEDNKRYAVELAQQDAVVLGGHLAERNGEMEEKQVDVLLALKVADLADRVRQLSAPFSTIVVLSEDMDLMPSFEFAAQRGVTVYAAAFDTVHNRTDQTSWLVLDENSMRKICPPPAAIALGTPMRELIARMATTPAPTQAPVWKIETWDNSKREVVLSNSKGVTGVLHERRKNAHVDERLFLYATGIEMEPKSKRFPLLTLGRSRPEGERFEGVEFATVMYWVQSTRVKVKFEGTDEVATLTASPGQLLKGQRVAVFRTLTDGKSANYYIGPVGDPPDHGEWPLPDATAVVTIVGDGPGNGSWRAQIAGLETTVVVPKSPLKHVAVGDRLRVALAGKTNAGELLVQPLTCCLPEAREKMHKVAPRT